MALPLKFLMENDYRTDGPSGPSGETPWHVKVPPLESQKKETTETQERARPASLVLDVLNSGTALLNLSENGGFRPPTV